MNERSYHSIPAGIPCQALTLERCQALPKCLAPVEETHILYNNPAYLREKFGAKIAMHSADSDMLARRDMSWIRAGPVLRRGRCRKLSSTTQIERLLLASS
jgi:hypothetical protein